MIRVLFTMEDVERANFATFDPNFYSNKGQGVIGYRSPNAAVRPAAVASTGAAVGGASLGSRVGGAVDAAGSGIKRAASATGQGAKRAGAFVVSTSKSGLKFLRRNTARAARTGGGLAGRGLGAAGSGISRLGAAAARSPGKAGAIIGAGAALAGGGAYLANRNNNYSRYQRRVVRF